jgi:hypothetical protein
MGQFVELKRVLLREKNNVLLEMKMTETRNNLYEKLLCVESKMKEKNAHKIILLLLKLQH